MERKRIFRGDRLREVREAQNLSQDDLSIRLGLGGAQMHRYETGKSDPSPEVMVRLAKELDVTTDYLLGLVDDPNTNLHEEDLSPDERRLLAAYRRGDLRSAMQVLVSETAENSG